MIRKIRKINKLFSLLIIAVFLAGCFNSPVVRKTASTDAEEVVSLYYNSLNNQDYQTMYLLISDGFKKIDPQGKDFTTFKNYMDDFHDSSSGVEVVSVEETSNNNQRASVDYAINILKQKNKKTEFKSTFTLKQTSNGWKLIHPYGENIDNS